MVKFLGVISNSVTKNDDRVLEYTDLDLLANYLNSETNNLFDDFVRKVKFVNEREMQILDNANKFKDIYDFYQALSGRMVEVERGTDNVGYYLQEVEKTIDVLENVPKDASACKCTSNFERNKALDRLVQLSEEMDRLECDLDKVEKEEEYLPLREPSCFTHKLIPFLDMHTKILEQIENKICKIADVLHDVNEMFYYAQRKIRGDHYHKPKYNFVTEC